MFGYFGAIYQEFTKRCLSVESPLTNIYIYVLVYVYMYVCMCPVGTESYMKGSAKFGNYVKILTVSTRHWVSVVLRGLCYFHMLL